MDVKQIYSLVNSITQEIAGDSGLIKEDFTNLVDVGSAVLGTDSDNYVKALSNRIGKTIFNSDVYKPSLVPSVMRDSWEYGSILQSVNAVLPDAVSNDSWSLTNGTDYSPNIFYKPSVSQKFYNKRVTFEINMSFTEKQVKESFNSQTELNSFVNMLYQTVENSFAMKAESLVQRTINNMIAETVKDQSGVTGSLIFVNLLDKFLTERGITGESALTAANCLQSVDFLKYIAFQILRYRDLLKSPSKLFNIEDVMRFSAPENINAVMLSEVYQRIQVFLESGIFNPDKLALNNIFTVPYWQGSGTSFAFDDISTVKVKTASNTDVTQEGIIGVMFDKNAIGVCNSEKRVTTNFNPRAEFYTNFYKYDCQYFNDLSQNCVVFYIADRE
jgi:hypothetical protein